MDSKKDLLFVGATKSPLDVTRDQKPNFAPVPRSSVLDRVKNFLPIMKEANADLERAMKENPSQFNIEEVEESKPYIEMDLGFVKQQKTILQEASSEDSLHSDEMQCEEAENERFSYVPSKEYIPPSEPVIVVSMGNSYSEEGSDDFETETDGNQIITADPQISHDSA